MILIFYFYKKKWCLELVWLCQGWKTFSICKLIPIIFQNHYIINFQILRGHTLFKINEVSSANNLANDYKIFMTSASTGAHLECWSLRTTLCCLSLRKLWKNLSKFPEIPRVSSLYKIFMQNFIKCFRNIRKNTSYFKWWIMTKIWVNTRNNWQNW